MLEITIEDNGELNPIELKEFGKSYSLMDRIRMNGVGSSRIVYGQGIPFFDVVFNAKKELAGGQNFVNFELLSQGLLLHFNHQNVLRCAALKLKDIQEIELIEYGSNRNYNRIKSAAITFIEKTEKNSFTFLSRDLKNILKYFGRKEFTGKLNYITTDQSPNDGFLDSINKA